MSPLHELQPRGPARVALDGRQVAAVAGVRQLVEHRDARPVVARENVANEGGADEAGAAGDQQMW